MNSDTKSFETIVIKETQNRGSKGGPSFLLRLAAFLLRCLSYIFPKYTAQKCYLLFTNPFGRVHHFRQDRLLEMAEVSDFLFGKHLLKKYTWGSSDKTILLVHGWRSRGTALRAYVPDLLEQGFQVITFDGPGHGDSPGKRLNLGVYSNIISSLNRQYNIQGIIAHSFGGGSALVSLLKDKDDVYLPKMVAIASPVNICWVVDSFLERLGLSQRSRNHFKAIISEKMKLPFEMGNANVFFDKLPLGKLLLIHDKDDKNVPFRLSEELYQNFDNTELIATVGLGHTRILKNEQVLQRVKSFFSNP